MSRTPTMHGSEEASSPAPPLPILFFDSSCLLCSRSVRWIIHHDPGKVFSFAGLDSKAAEKYLPNDHPLRSEDTVILLDGDGIHGRSEAVFRTLRSLRTFMKILLVFSVFPRSWTDCGYRWIASRRYRWFGRDESCPLPDPDAKSRFLTD